MGRIIFDPDDRKTVELRKPGFGRFLLPGDTIAIYATLPVGEVVGTVVVAKCECKSTESLWQSIDEGRCAKVSRSEFSVYYQNAKAAIAIWVKQPELFQRPVSLAELRSHWGGWQPPQQIQRLAPDQVAILVDLSRS